MYALSWAQISLTALVYVYLILFWSTPYLVLLAYRDTAQNYYPISHVKGGEYHGYRPPLVPPWIFCPHCCQEARLAFVYICPSVANSVADPHNTQHSSFKMDPSLIFDFVPIIPMGCT